MKLNKTATTLISVILFFRMSAFMSFPFLVIRLQELQFSPLKIGLVIGLPYLFSGLSGIFGGNISDQIGQKKTIFFSLIMAGCAFFMLGKMENAAGIIFVNYLILLNDIIFESAASSLLAHSVTKDLHAIAFRYRHIAINLGASVGPMLGGLMAQLKIVNAFSVTGTLFIILPVILLFIKTPSTGLNKNYSLARLKNTLSIMRQDSVLIFLLLAIIFVSMTYCQMFSTLPQILSHQFENSIKIYTILLTANPLTVISIGFLLSNLLARQKTGILFMYGCILLIIAFIGFQFSPASVSYYVVMMVIFTLGEIILMPASSKFLIDLAPESKKGSYLGGESFYHLGYFFGNMIGSSLLQHNFSVFIFCALSALFGLLAYSNAYRLFRKKELILSGG